MLDAYISDILYILELYDINKNIVNGIEVGSLGKKSKTELRVCNISDIKYVSF